MSDLQRVGPSYGGTGTPTPFRADVTGAQAVADAHGRYAEAARRGTLFYAASQAAQAISVALATAYTGLVLSNPLNSKVNLELLNVGLALSVAPAAIAPLGLIGGQSSTAVIHTTPVAPGSTILGGPQGYGLTDGVATIPTPKWLQMLMSGFTAAALPSTSPVDIDIAGKWVVPPGGFIAIGALTAVTGFWSMLWEEVPVLS
jgi:hypothetical protein